MLNIAVMVSGGGTNLGALINAFQNGEIKGGKIAVVISSSREAFALKRAKEAELAAETVSKKDYPTAEDFDNALLLTLEKYQIDLVVLAGYLHILSEKVVEKFRNRMINIHPSLLPSFGGEGFYGLKVHKAALDYGVKVTGATVHFVTKGCDKGPIILQKAVYIEKDDTENTLQKRVMEEAEWELLPKAVSLICEGRVKVIGNTVRIG